MRYIALEEAFSVPELPDRRPSPWLGLPLSQHYLEDWARRLPDFNEYRLPAMDAAGIDVQVLSLTVPGQDRPPQRRTHPAAMTPVPRNRCDRPLRQLRHVRRGGAGDDRHGLGQGRGP
jgi:hypothetical protein